MEAFLSEFCFFQIILGKFNNREGKWRDGCNNSLVSSLKILDKLETCVNKENQAFYNWIILKTSVMSVGDFLTKKCLIFKL